MADRKITAGTSHAQRNSSIELLRIISIIMVLFHHFARYGIFDWENAWLSVPHLWYNFIVMGGKIGVNIFVFISGFFLIQNKNNLFNLKKILRFWGEVFFYSFGIYVICGACGLINWEFNTFIAACFPITFSTNWFASTYFVLYLLHPFLNKLLYSLNKKTYQSLLILLVICWSIIPMLSSQNFQGNDLSWFITLYAISGYVRIFGFRKEFSAKHYFICAGGFSLLTYLTSVILSILSMRWSRFSRLIWYFFQSNSITILLVSLSLFLAFANLKMNYHKWINLIASATFGVYLIHENSVIRDLLWKQVFKNPSSLCSITLIPYSMIVVFIIFVICTMIDLIRQRIFEKPFLLIVNRYIDSWLKPIKKLYHLVSNIVFGKE